MKIKLVNVLVLSLFFSLFSCQMKIKDDSLTKKSLDPFFDTLALKPPMGWNSYDNFDNSVTEADVKANADYIAENML
jgi:alpha-galactosidase